MWRRGQGEAALDDHPNGAPAVSGSSYLEAGVRRGLTTRLCVALALGLTLLGLSTTAGAARERGLSAPQVKSLLLQRALGADRGAHKGFPAQTASDVPVPCGKPTGVLCATVTVPLDR